jgi:DNA-binding transcriptional LysR family regulator
MDLRLIRTFVKVAELESFTAAANKLGYAQSTVTAQIKLLENDLNTILFERIGKAIFLTKDGRNFLTYAKQLISMEREIYNTFGASAKNNGSLIIGAAQSLCNDLVPCILKEYKSKYPEVTIKIKFEDSCSFPQMLKQNEIDLAFSIGQQVHSDELVCFAKREEQMCFLAAPDYPLAKENKITLEQIKQYPLLLTEEGCAYHNELMRLAEEYSVSLNIMLESGNVQMLKQFAINGLGIAFLPLTAVAESIDRKELIILPWQEEQFHIVSEVLYHKDKYISPVLKNFMDVTNLIYY